jgi:DNA invertase Pin-like site-specific DNA recombinase
VAQGDGCTASWRYLYVRWLDRISRRYDELHNTMQVLMQRGVTVRCTMNGMVFDGATDDPIAKRPVMLSWPSWLQGEVDYVNRKEMQRRGIQPKEEGRYTGRPKSVDDAAVAAWKAETGATIKATAGTFGIGESSVKRALKYHALVYRWVTWRDILSGSC